MKNYVEDPVGFVISKSKSRVKLGRYLEIGGVIVDDIIASGGTVNALIDYSGAVKSDACTLLLSGKIRGDYRCKDGSTVRGIETLITAQIVEWEKGMPATSPSVFSSKKPEQTAAMSNTSQNTQTAIRNE